MATLDDYNANIIDLVPCLLENALKELSDTKMDLSAKKEIKEAREYALKRVSAILLLIGADCRRYVTMKNHMQQNMAMGANNYHKLVNKTMNILNTFIKMNKTIYGKRVTKKLKEGGYICSSKRFKQGHLLQLSKERSLCKNLS